MNSKSLSLFREARGSGRSESSDAGIIVLLMMALVFVPVVAVHVASLWPGDVSLPRLATIGSMLQAMF
jgi:hypothetical protein